MTSHAAAVATGTSTSASDPQGRAVSLNMSEALAMIALLALSGAGLRADVGFVTCWNGQYDLDRDGRSPARW